MKVKNPSTGNFEEVYVKALDSLPVGTEVDFTGSASDIPVGWEQVDSYSTNELNTGKTWIDGKPIYRKVISYTSSSTSGSFVSQQTNITNAETIIKFEGYIFRSNFANSIPFKENDNNYADISFRFSDGVLATRVGSGMISLPIIVILEYTKTTD